MVGTHLYTVKAATSKGGAGLALSGQLVLRPTIVGRVRSRLAMMAPTRVPRQVRVAYVFPH